MAVAGTVLSRTVGHSPSRRLSIGCVSSLSEEVQAWLNVILSHCTGQARVSSSRPPASEPGSYWLLVYTLTMALIVGINGYGIAGKLIQACAPDLPE